MCRTRQTRRHLPSRAARSRQTRRHLPKAIFEKNVTRLDTFARVIGHFGEFGASGHCLVIMPNCLWKTFERWPNDNINFDHNGTPLLNCNSQLEGQHCRNWNHLKNVNLLIQITFTKEMKKQLYHVANRLGSEVATERRASWVSLTVWMWTSNIDCPLWPCRRTAWIQNEL